MAAMPDVAAVSRALFGDLVDPDALVAKMDPGPSDVHVMGGSNRAVLIPRKTSRGRKVSERTKFGKDNSFGRHLMEGVGIGATAIGGALGVKELNHSLPAARGIWRTKAGWVKPIATGAKGLAKVPRPGPAARVAGVGGMLLGDAIATNEQVRSARKPVNKAMPPVGRLVEGILHNSRTMNAIHAPDVVANTKQFGEQIPGALKNKQMAAMKTGNRRKATKPLIQSYGGPQGASERLDWLRERKASRAAAKPAPTPKLSGTQRAIQMGQGARADFNSMAGTISGKVVLGGAGLATAHHLYARRANAAPPFDPYMAKADSRDDVTFTGTFSKFDDERRLAFGWANVSKVNGLPVVDRQGDYVSIEDIEDAAYTYVESSRVGGHMHRRVGGKAAGTIDRPHHVSNLVESMVFDDAKVETLGLPDDFPRGWWVGFRVFDDGVWDKARNGELTGFSIHGKGIRKSVDYDDIMAGR